jgi:hypothetical protein
MPKLTAHFSQKLPTAEYANQQFCASIEAEIDSSDPNAIQSGLRRLFTLARQAVDEQFRGGAQDQKAFPAMAPANAPPSAPRNGSTPGNGRAVPATVSQKKAIFAIAKAVGVRVNRDEIENLTLRQASEFIDKLKQQQGAQ